ncbi:MAG TPA: N-acetylmuramoyl-L-alanine amidase [Chitinophagaceae bacterium]|nr:N-acetylmuramoyl-L-alanine amidase [Chitinophagaceae bacterium]
MKLVKRSNFLLLAALAGMVIVSSFGDAPVVAPQKPTLRTLIIDAGHGGRDQGAKGLISTEAAISLDIALKVGRAIEKEFPEIKVVYTRTSDQLPGNASDASHGNRIRAEMANQAKGDLFISIHCNANAYPAGGYYAKRIVGYKNKTTYVGKGKKRRKKTVKAPIYESYWVKNMTKGTETYIWAADRSGFKGSVIDQTEEFGEDVQDSLNVLDLTSPEAKIRAQLYEKQFFAKSALMASLVEDEFKKAGRLSKGVKQRNHKGIWVLQATGMPSILVETGFITNKEEEEYLVSEAGQDEITNNIVEAFRRYKRELETTRATNTR